MDTTRFTELELRLYGLIKAGAATMQELKTCYTLDEALKLHALVRMENDIESARAKELGARSKKGR